MVSYIRAAMQYPLCISWCLYNKENITGRLELRNFSTSVETFEEEFRTSALPYNILLSPDKLSSKKYMFLIEHELLNS